MRTMHWIGTLAVAISLAPACSRSKSDVGSRSSGPSAKLAGNETNAIPATAIGFLAVGLDPGELRRFAGMLLDDAAAQAMIEELEGFLLRRTGLRLGGVDGVAFFALRDGSTAIAVRGVEGELRLPTSPEDDRKRARPDDEEFNERGRYDEPDWPEEMAVVGDTLLLGDHRAVQDAKEALQDPAASLGRARPELARLYADAARGAFLAGTLDVSATPLAELGPLRGAGPLQAAVAVRDDGIRLVAEGSDADLRNLAEALRGGLQMMSGMAAALKVEATAADAPLVQGLGAIVAAHGAKFLEETLQPRLAGGRLEIALPFDADDATGMLPLLGVAAAVAVPAMLRYTEEAKEAASAVAVERAQRESEAYLAEHGRLPDIAAKPDAAGSGEPDGPGEPVVVTDDGPGGLGPLTALDGPGDDPLSPDIEDEADELERFIRMPDLPPVVAARAEIVRLVRRMKALEESEDESAMVDVEYEAIALQTAEVRHRLAFQVCLYPPELKVLVEQRMAEAGRALESFRVAAREVDRLADFDSPDADRAWERHNRMAERMAEVTSGIDELSYVWMELCPSVFEADEELFPVELP